MMIMSDMKSGTEGRVVAISGGREARQKLMNLGLVPGEAFAVVREVTSGPLLIKVNETQIMVGRGMAEKVRVHTA